MRRGYGVEVRQDPWHDAPTDTAALSSWADVAALVRDQHAALDQELNRVPDLAGFALLDVCLHLRRTLAVHAALESALESALATPATGAVDDLGRVVRAAEEAEARGDEAAVVTAWRRVRVAFVHHVDQVEATGPIDLAGRLDPAEAAIVAEAVRLWDGRGDASLGHEYDVMCAVAAARLTDAATDERRGHEQAPA